MEDPRAHLKRLLETLENLDRWLAGARGETALVEHVLALREARERLAATITRLEEKLVHVEARRARKKPPGTEPE